MSKELTGLAEAVGVYEPRPRITHDMHYGALYGAMIVVALWQVAF